MIATHTIKSDGKWYAKGEEVPDKGSSSPYTENAINNQEEPKKRGRKPKTEES